MNMGKLNMRHQHKRPPSAVKLQPVSPPSKGKIAHRIIARVAEKGREYTFHATKGYRSTRA